MIEIMYSQATLTMPYLLITGKPVLVSTSVLEANLSLWDHLRTRKGGGSWRGLEAQPDHIFPVIKTCYSLFLANLCLPYIPRHHPSTLPFLFLCASLGEFPTYPGLRN